MESPCAVSGPFSRAKTEDDDARDEARDRDIGVSRAEGEGEGVPPRERRSKADALHRTLVSYCPPPGRSAETVMVPPSTDERAVASSVGDSGAAGVPCDLGSRVQGFWDLGLGVQGLGIVWLKKD
jgi:hypothetical protein